MSEEVTLLKQISLNGLKQREEAHPDLIEGLRPRLERVERVMIDFEKERRRIDEDPRYSSVGQLEAKEKLVQATIKELDQIRSDARHYPDQISQVERQMQIDPQDDNPVLAFIREQEIRSQLRGMDPLEVERLYKEAARGGDIEFMRAVERAPRAFPIVKPDLIQEGQTILRQARFPELTKKVQELRRIDETLNSLLATARKVLSDAISGRPLDDRLAQQAKAGA
ncbi:hypothetical protein [Candidatus Nitrospira bockiana]